MKRTQLGSATGAIRKSLAPLLAFAVLGSVRAEAFPIGMDTCQFPNYDANGPYMSLYPSSASQGYNGWTRYDSATDLLSLPAAANESMRFADHPGAPGATTFTGTYSLYMNATQSYDSAGGIFSIFAAVPSLGITTPSLLLAAHVTGADIGPCAQRGGGVEMQVFMQVDYSNPGFGDWGSSIALTGFFEQFRDQGGAPIHPEPDFNDLFSQSWMNAPADYYDLWSLAEPTAAPEPSSSLLVACGLGAALLVLWLRRMSNASRARGVTAASYRKSRTPTT